MRSERRVSTIELFFDLVFVFTITQLAHLLEDNLTPEGVFQVILIFVVLFWMYGAYAWLTNQVAPDTAVRQVWLVAGMAGFLVCALAIPHALDDKAIIFGIGHLWVVMVHTVLYAKSFGAAVWQFSPFNFLSAILILGATSLETPVLYGLWLLAILSQTIPPVLVRRTMSFDVQPAHFVERHGLLLIVALGESIIAIGAAIDPSELDVQLAVAAILSLALCAAMWWEYFAFDPERAEHMLSSVSTSERNRAAIGGYFYAFLIMLLGVVAMAVGIKESLGHFDEAIEYPVALVLAAGVGVYLVGQIAFRYAMRFEIGRLRLIAPILAIATTTLGTWVSAGSELVALVALLVVVAFVDSRSQIARHVHSGTS